MTEKRWYLKPECEHRFMIGHHHHLCWKLRKTCREAYGTVGCKYEKPHCPHCGKLLEQLEV